MGIQDKTEFISKHLFKQIDRRTEMTPSFHSRLISDNQANLNYKTSNNLKNMLKSTLQNCKYLVKLSAISLSAVTMILTGQPEKVEASTNKNANILHSFLSKSSQTVLNWEGNLRNKNRFSTLKQNPLSTLNINQNIYENLLSKLPATEIGESVKTEKAGQFSNTLKLSNNPYIQNLSLAKQPNWSSATRELSNSKSQTFSEIRAEERVFQIPSFETNQTQPGQYTELNSKSPRSKKTVKQVYIVKQGDTLNEIANFHGVSRQELIKKNNIRNPHLIFVAQQIQIPQTKEKESLETREVANNNETKILAQNNSQKNNYPRQKFVTQLSGLDNVEMENYDDLASEPTEMTITLGTTITPELPPLSSPEQYLPASPAEFDGYIWPAKGKLTSGYGWRWGRAHRGIDIAAPIGTPIIAAASGEVISAGWNSGGYGNLVKVKHPNGSVTLYAHNHKIMVRRGQKVQQGQQIAQMGSTGYSTGSHLHFEIRSNGKTAVNPIAYLPKK